MVPSGTTAAVPYWGVRVASTTQPPTGEWDSYERTAYAYYGMYPSKVEALDPRKDPKMWKLWFREFLALVFPRVCAGVVMPATPVLPRFAPRCRSGTIPIREWKMKNWVQALNQQN